MRVYLHPPGPQTLPKLPPPAAFPNPRPNCEAALLFLAPPLTLLAFCLPQESGSPYSGSTIDIKNDFIINIKPSFCCFFLGVYFGDFDNIIVTRVFKAKDDNKANKSM